MNENERMNGQTAPKHNAFADTVGWQKDTNNKLAP